MPDLAFDADAAVARLSRDVPPLGPGRGQDVQDDRRREAGLPEVLDRVIDKRVKEFYHLTPPSRRR